MQVATIAPQTSRGLLAVGPDMAKVLAVAALRKASLISVLYLDDIQLDSLSRCYVSC
jgi:hypothetical protein